MLPSNARLNRRKFTEILKNKGISVVFNRLGTLKYISSEAKSLSVVTSSKHEKKAVARNKLRRRVYTLFAVNTLPIQGMLYSSKGSYALEYNEIKSLFNELLAKTQKSTNKWLNSCVVIGIMLYRAVFSPSVGILRTLPLPSANVCFYPTCSEYSVLCFKKYSFLKALQKTIGRIGRCHPGTTPSVDLP